VVLDAPLISSPAEVFMQIDEHQIGVAAAVLVALWFLTRR
jgi:hypothetical protein